MRARHPVRIAVALPVFAWPGGGRGDTLPGTERATAVANPCSYLSVVARDTPSFGVAARGRGAELTGALVPVLVSRRGLIGSGVPGAGRVGPPGLCPFGGARPVGGACAASASSPSPRNSRAAQLRVDLLLQEPRRSQRAQDAALLHRVPRGQLRSPSACTRRSHGWRYSTATPLRTLRGPAGRPCRIAGTPSLAAGGDALRCFWRSSPSLRR